MMGVQLNIKDPETVRLARELAGANGTSVTQTIRIALERATAERETLIQERLAKFTAAADELGKQFRASMPAEWRGKTSTEIMNSIYNDDGSFAE